MSTPDLTKLRKDVKDLPSDFDKTELLRELGELEENCRRTDDLVNKMRAEEEGRNRTLKRKGLLAIPIFLVAAIGFAWYLTNALTDGYVTHRQKVISSSADPLYFWFSLVWPAAGFVACVICIAYLLKFVFLTTQNAKR